MKLKIILVLVLLLPYINTNMSFAENTTEWQFRDMKNLKKLDDFKTINDFEKYLGNYIQTCLDTGSGGTAAALCHARTQIWDRELDLIYNKLYNSSDKNGKSKLLVSQTTWLKDKESSLEFSYYLIDRKYPKQDTMYYLLRAGDADDIMSSIVKNRVLFLRDMHKEVLEEKLWEEEKEKERLLEEKMYEDMLKEDSN